MILGVDFANQMYTLLMVFSAVAYESALFSISLENYLKIWEATGELQGESVRYFTKAFLKAMGV